MSSGRLQEVKNSGKSLTIRPKNWSRSLTGGGRGSNCKALTGKILMFLDFDVIEVRLFSH